MPTAQVSTLAKALEEIGETMAANLIIKSHQPPSQNPSGHGVLVNSNSADALTD